MLTVLDLFSGIGGFSLGLERTGGFKTIAFCEINEYCRNVLWRHWPNVPCFQDVRTLQGGSLEPVDVIAGGFPCQDLSLLGRGKGLAGARSGLWSEFHRLIAECEPRWVIIENVTALRGRGLGRILGQLAALGFDARWDCIPAASIGAPHLRDRLWITAHATRFGRREVVLNVNRSTELWPQDRQYSGCFADTVRERVRQSGVCGVVDGLPHRMERINALGNTVMPQIPELIGRAILEAEGIKP